jgi:phospholipid-binding lipoprotein MlaA
VSRAATGSRRRRDIVLTMLWLILAGAPMTVRAASGPQGATQLQFSSDLARAADGSPAELRAGWSSAAPTDAPTADPSSGGAFHERASAAAASLTEKAGAVLRPLAEAAREAVSGPAAARTLAVAGAMARDLGSRMRRSLVDPIVAVASGRGTTAEVAAGASSRAGATPAILPVAAAVPPALPEHLEDRLRDAATIDDPLEEFNRLMFDVNVRLRARLIHPVTDFYLRVTAPPVQAGVRNFFANLREPATIASSLIEGEFADAGNASARFGINSTIGVVGVFDPATELGYPSRPHDLEETLCVLGLPSGPYLVLPIFGPGTIRDAVGRITTVAAYYEVMGLTVYVPYRATDIAVRSIDVQDQLARLYATSIDPYVAERVLCLSTRGLGCGRQAAAERELFTK